ncbi:hypothetical protein [Acinetobacter larvae]|uniref:Uncharacterized protein n=1 Tax=Acinetobacter larvae TaxID=1789224 RepID=A0A1B2M2P8_9GAMM|nr:hypothetical protein [Acinetobacter larvae]AOA59476.1 hypothetical protein BFG52_14725 [Acinetobacter larvae]
MLFDLFKNSSLSKYIEYAVCDDDCLEVFFIDSDELFILWNSNLDINYATIISNNIRLPSLIIF